MNTLLTSSAIDLAARIRTREVSAREVVEVHIQQAQRANPELNAIVVDRYDAARREATLADDRVRAGGDDLPPLLGVPCTIKEAFAVEGMPNSSGLVARKDRRCDRDAITVTRLRRAGAIPLGVTNVSELCMWMESSNRVYGRTNNPYDPSRIVGGSSGGEGAIIGCGASPFGLGSDIGGSIRMPAFFNGVFGHKPTGGMVPSSGQFPVAAEGALRYLTTGPLARRAEDLMPLLRILAGPDPGDARCAPFELGDPAAVAIDSLRVISIADNGGVRVSSELQAAQQRCEEALARRGARVERRSISALRHSFDIWSAALTEAGGPSFSSMLGEGTEITPYRELAAWALRRSPHTLPAIALAMLEKVGKVMPARTRRFVEVGRRLRDELSALLADDGVILYPSYPSVAPRHLKPMMPPFQWVYTAVFNVMELPVTQVPLGLGRELLPLGVQVVARHGRDHQSIAVAMALEEDFGGWVPPPRWS